MIDPDKPNYVTRVADEVKAMASDGFAHPSTRPVLTGAGIGALAGLLLPVLTIPVGMVAGAGYALWRRIKQ